MCPSPLGTTLQTSFFLQSLAKEPFYLSVETAQVVVRPFLQCVMDIGVESKQDLLLLAHP